MTNPSTPGKVIVIHTETGEEHERWPIDAREMIATGEYEQKPGSLPKVQPLDSGTMPESEDVPAYDVPPPEKDEAAAPKTKVTAKKAPPKKKPTRRKKPAAKPKPAPTEE